jgi:PAS domain S-box-containing protein
LEVVVSPAQLKLTIILILNKSLMQNIMNVTFTNSISVTLLKAVFGIYVIIAISVTAIHMTIDYVNEKKMVRQDLKLYQITFGPILGDAVWHMNQEHIASGSSSLLNLPSVVGVSIINSKNQVLKSVGTVSDIEKKMTYIDIDENIISIPKELNFSQDLFRNEFDIVNPEDPEQEILGRAVIYSNSIVVFNRVKNGFLMLIMNAIIKTIALWIIFIIFARVLLKRPLEIMTATANQLNLDSLGNVRMDIKTSKMNEFKVLEITFNKLLAKLNISFNSLKKAESELQIANEKLEHRVEVRTRELTKAEKYVSNIIRSMADTLIVINFDTTITSVNQATIDLLGYKEHELIGKSLNIILGEKKGDKRNLSIDEIIAKDHINAVESIYLTKNGTEISVLFSGSVLHDDEDTQAIICVAQDISERLQAQEQIKASLKEKETLLQEIHHRVKNNLTVISSLLSLQARQTEDKTAKAVLQDSQTRVQAMSMIHETLYRSDNLSSIDLNTYLSKLAKAVAQNYVIGSKVNLQVEAENVMIGVKQASPLGLVVNELITNSFKYAFPDNQESEIRISLQKKEDQIELEYADNGIGMPEDFDWRKAESMGLSLVKLIVENQLDGSVDVESKNGTKFIIRFSFNET